MVGMQNTEESFGINQGIVHIIINTMKLTDRCTHVGKQHDVIHNLTDRHTRIVDQHQIGRQDDDEHSTYLLDKVLQSVEHIALFAGVQLQICHRALDISLSLGLYFFAIKRLNHADTLDDVQDALTHSLMTAEYATATTFHFCGLNVSNPEIQGDDAQSHETHIDVGCEHQG